MVVWGSITLVQSLMKAGVIDEVHLRVCPVAIGSGRRLFPDDVAPDLRLLKTKAYANGVVLLKYGLSKEG